MKPKSFRFSENDIIKLEESKIRHRLDSDLEVIRFLLTRDSALPQSVEVEDSQAQPSKMVIGPDGGIIEDEMILKDRARKAGLKSRTPIDTIPEELKSYAIGTFLPAEADNVAGKNYDPYLHPYIDITYD